MTPTATWLPQATNYRVDIQADTTRLKVGENVTLTGLIVGGFGNPLYTIKVEDQNTPPAVLQVRLTPSNEVREASGASNILALVSTQVVSNQVRVVLQGRGPGVTEVSISVNGEIGETDGSGHWWFKAATKFSEGVVITVTAP